MNRYLSAIIVLAALSNVELHAQSLSPAPRLVVNIIVDQLRTDYMEQFSSLYSSDGFKKLLQQGCVYEAASYPFSPVDRASAIAAITTGTTPHYNNIVGGEWLDRATLRPVHCYDDEKYGTSPQKLATSTIGDELKVATRGAAKVYGIAVDKDAAVLSAGHAADGAFWINERSGQWATSPYYPSPSQSLIRAYNSTHSYAADNDATAKLSIACMNDMALGMDDITDMLSVTLSAKGKDPENWQTEMEILYIKLDKAIGEIVKAAETKVGTDNVVFVLTSTGYTDNEPVDYERYHIPTGTFYINRTADLLNMYLGAIFGQGRYVELCYHNQIYIDRKLLEQRHISFGDVVSRSEELLTQVSGVRKVSTSPYSPSVSGDIIVEVAPGWKLVNEDSQEQYMSRAAFVPFPIIVYGAGIKAQRISTPASVDRIAPTIAKAIRIRAPNACATAPLQ